MITTTIILITIYLFKKKFKRPLKVPKKVLSNFESLFPDIEKAHWELYRKKEYKLYEVSFLNNEVWDSIVFLEDGERMG